MSAVRVGNKGCSSFTKSIIALALADGSVGLAAEIAADKYGHRAPEVPAYYKALVSAGSIGGLTWGHELAPYISIATEFRESVRAASLLTRLPAVQIVPLRMPVITDQHSGVSYWVASGSPKPVTQLSLSNVGNLPARTLVSIVVLSKELFQFGGSVAEQTIQRILIRENVRALERAMLDPTSAATTARPASITNGSLHLAGSGGTSTQIASDLDQMVVEASAANEDFANPVYVTTPRVAARLALKRDTAGGPAFPGVSVNGGMLGGIPLITTPAARTDDSPATEFIALFDSSMLFFGEDDGIQVSITGEADVQLDDAPSAGAASMVSLWATNRIGVRIERTVNWTMSRPAAATLDVAF